MGRGYLLGSAVYMALGRWGQMDGWTCGWMDRWTCGQGDTMRWLQRMESQEGG